MPGAISSLGLGSGVLTSDVLDKLKKADNEAQVKPIEKKLKVDEAKQKSLELFNSLMTSFTSSVDALKDSTMYQKRTVAGTDDTVDVKAETGVAVQKFSLENTKLAQENVVQSATFKSPNDKVANGIGKFNINIDGKNYKIDYDKNTTYADLKDRINNEASSAVTATILQNGDQAYTLVITSKETGKDQQITLTDLNGALNDGLKSDSIKSAAFKTPAEKIAKADGELTLNVGNLSAVYKYGANTSISELARMINSDARINANVQAAIVQNIAGTYNLVITSKKASEGDPITICDQAGGTLDNRLIDGVLNDPGKATDVQTAEDATFKYNGIKLSRPTNEIKDIMPGVTIDLLKPNESSTTIDITQDTKPIGEAMQSFVESYNSMAKQLDTMTLTDVAAGKIGLFNGDNSLNMLNRNISRIITSTNAKGVSLVQYGIDVKKDGTLSFNAGTFQAKMMQDPKAMADFFSSKTEVDSRGNSKEIKGVFAQLGDNLKNLTAQDGILTTMSDSLDNDVKSLTKDKEAAVKSLKTKYDTMTDRFIAYDTMINKMNSKFASLKQQIAMQVNSKH